MKASVIYYFLFCILFENLLFVFHSIFGLKHLKPELFGKDLHSKTTMISSNIKTPISEMLFVLRVFIYTATTIIYEFVFCEGRARFFTLIVILGIAFVAHKIIWSKPMYKLMEILLLPFVGIICACSKICRAVLSKIKN